MQIPVFLAHGALGEWDELIFLGVIVVFLVIMGISWVVSRMNPPRMDDDHVVTSSESTSEQPERFKLD